jgi:hypothetical protein
MQILTKCLIVCVLAAITAPLCARAADTDAQMKAREALRQKVSELDAQTAVTNPPPIAAPKTKPAPEPAVSNPTPAPAPAETVKTVPTPTPAPASAVETTSTPPPAPVVKTRKPKPAPAARTAPVGQYTASRPDSEKVAKARVALEEKMREINAQGSEPGQPAVVSQPLVTRPVVATQPPANTPPPVHRSPEITSTSQPTASPEMRELTEPLPTPPPVKKTAQSESTKPQPSKKPNQTRPMPEPVRYALPPGPPPPVSADKLQKLNILLQQYQADRITPEQYHQERAKILAGP